MAQAVEKVPSFDLEVGTSLGTDWPDHIFARHLAVPKTGAPSFWIIRRMMATQTGCPLGVFARHGRGYLECSLVTDRPL